MRNIMSSVSCGVLLERFFTLDRSSIPIFAESSSSLCLPHHRRHLLWRHLLRGSLLRISFSKNHSYFSSLFLSAGAFLLCSVGKVNWAFRFLLPPSSVNGEWQRRRGGLLYFAPSRRSFENRAQIQDAAMWPEFVGEPSRVLQELGPYASATNKGKVIHFRSHPNTLYKGAGNMSAAQICIILLCLSLSSLLCSPLLRSPSRDYSRPSESTLEKALSTNSSASPILKRRQRCSAVAEAGAEDPSEPYYTTDLGFVYSQQDLK